MALLVDARECPVVWVDALLFDSGAVARIGPHAFTVYCALARHANGQGECFPSMARLSRLTGVSLRHVANCIRILLDECLIERVKQGGGRERSNVYRLLSVEVATGQTRSIPDKTDPASTLSGAGTTIKRKESEPRSGGKGEDALFAEAWEAYPRKKGVSKSAALRAWSARIKEGVDPQAMVDGVHAYASFCQADKRDQQYIKQPATFFGPDRWWEADYSIPGGSTSKDSKPTVRELEKFNEDEEVV